MEGHAYFWYLYATNASDYSQWPIINNVAYVPVQVAITLLVGQLGPPDCTYLLLPFTDCLSQSTRGCLFCVRMSQLRTLFSFSYVVQLPVIAKALGKRPSKRYLELFLDALFYGLVSHMLGIWGVQFISFWSKCLLLFCHSQLLTKGGGKQIQSTLHFQLAVVYLYCSISKCLYSVDAPSHSQLIWEWNHPYQNPKPNSKL